MSASRYEIVSLTFFSSLCIHFFREEIRPWLGLAYVKQLKNRILNDFGRSGGFFSHSETVIKLTATSPILVRCMSIFKAENS